jgi:hypothetical protein
MKNLIALVMLFVIGITFTSTANVIKDVKEVKKEVVFDTTLTIPIAFDVVGEVDVFKLKPDFIRNDETIIIVTEVIKTKFKPDNIHIDKVKNRTNELTKIKERFKPNKPRIQFNRTTNK